MRCSASSRMIMKAAPIGAFGAMAYTIGRYGPQALGNLAGLIATFYLTAGAFVFLVLGTIAWFAGFSIFKFLALHQGRAPDRARHELVGKRAAAIDGEARAARLLEAGRRTGRADGLFLQSRRHQHLYDAGDAVHRAGARRVAELRRADDDPHRRDAHLERCVRRNRRGFHHACRHAGGGAVRSSCPAWRSCSASTSS